MFNFKTTFSKLHAASTTCPRLQSRHRAVWSRRVRLEPRGRRLVADWRKRDVARGDNVGLAKTEMSPLATTWVTAKTEMSPRATTWVWRKAKCRRGRQCGNPTKSEMSPAARKNLGESEVSPEATSRKLRKSEMSPAATSRGCAWENRDVAAGDNVGIRRKARCHSSVNL